MELFEAIAILESVKNNRSKTKEIDGFDWLDTCDLAIEALRIEQSDQSEQTFSQCPGCEQFIVDNDGFGFCPYCGDSLPPGMLK